MNKKDEITALYRIVFASDKGLLVFEHILMDLKFTDQCNNEGDMALNNYAKTLIVKVFSEQPSQKTFWGLIKRLIQRK